MSAIFGRTNIFLFSTWGFHFSWATTLRGIPPASSVRRASRLAEFSHSTARKIGRCRVDATRRPPHASRRLPLFSCSSTSHIAFARTKSTASVTTRNFINRVVRLATRFVRALVCIRFCVATICEARIGADCDDGCAPLFLFCVVCRRPRSRRLSLQRVAGAQSPSPPPPPPPSDRPSGRPSASSLPSCKSVATRRWQRRRRRRRQRCRQRRRCSRQVARHASLRFAGRGEARVHSGCCCRSQRSWGAVADRQRPMRADAAAAAAAVNASVTCEDERRHVGGGRCVAMARTSFNCFL